MRFFLRTAVFLVLCAGLGAPAFAAGIHARVISESNGAIAIEFEDRRVESIAWSTEVIVAIPAAGTYTVIVDPGELEDVGVPFVDLDTLAPFPFRGARLLPIQIQVPGAFGGRAFIRNPVVTVQYPPGPSHDAEAADRLLRGAAVNANVFPRASRTNQPDPWLSRGAGWVRLRVGARGMYEVTGADLRLAGVQLASINNPSTMRMYTMNGRNLARSFAGTPDTWRRGSSILETAILVEGGGDGTFDADDRVIFYGLGPGDWLDYYEPGAPDTSYHDHTRADANEYFLTWDTTLPGPPRRMGARSSPPAGGTTRTSWRYREYHERNLVTAFDARGDGWFWIVTEIANRPILDDVNVTDLVPGVPQEFRTLLMSSATGNRHQIRYYSRPPSGEVLIGEFTWDGTQRFVDQGIESSRTGDFLENGRNRILFELTRALNPKDRGIVDWFAVFYEKRLRATGERLSFSSPDTTGVIDFVAGGFAGPPAARRAFDVTDPLDAVELTGLDTTTPGTVRFSAGIAGAPRHFEVSADGALRTPDAIERLTTRDLRAAPQGPNLLIVTDDELKPAAELLAAHRRVDLPGYPGGRVEVVTTQEIYDNFSGGLPDPVAIRNYVRYLYDNYGDAEGNPSLAYLLLFGDANQDFHNYASNEPDRVPGFINYYGNGAESYVTDEWFVHLDDSDLTPGRGMADVAVGRLPAASLDEGMVLVEKVIGYDDAAPLDMWRREIVLVADDVVSAVSGCGSFEKTHTRQSEDLAFRYTPEQVELKKVYLTEYNDIGGVKPGARFALLDRWNAGTLVVNYVGHGSTRQMADEQVFVETDVALLDNGLRLPVLMALSCTIGDYANFTQKSLSEKLLVREAGGAIATITASRLSFVGPNERLNLALFERLSPKAPDRRQPIGLMALEAKMRVLVRTRYNSSDEDNNWKYNLLGDPAMALALPPPDIRLEEMTADTLVTGLRKVLRGTVTAGGAVDTGFNGRVRVQVREPENPIQHYFVCHDSLGDREDVLPYRLSGGLMFDGTADVTAGRFEVSFRVPRSAGVGPRAFVSVYADDGVDDATLALDSVLVSVRPSAADSLSLRPADGPPRVDLRFKSGLETVKAGETVLAVVRDRDGINILDTTNEGTQAVIFDDVTVPIQVNRFFRFDHGGADTSGVLEYPLPDLDFGRHRLIYKVADAFGQVSLDTLVFNVTDPADYYARAVFNYPNPFTEDTRFLFQISDRAEIQLDIFTVAGRRIRRLEQVVDGGEQWLYWDGRDTVGDPIANGSYLYVARVTFTGLDRPPVVLRGKLSKIR